jgi:hypothetical protein
VTLAIIDLLYDNAQKANKVIDDFKPAITKEEYIKLLKDYSKKYIYQY